MGRILYTKSISVRINAIDFLFVLFMVPERYIIMYHVYHFALLKARY